jgi:hypothetical protein
VDVVTRESDTLGRQLIAKCGRGNEKKKRTRTCVLAAASGITDRYLSVGPTQKLTFFPSIDPVIWRD